MKQVSRLRSACAMAFGVAMAAIAFQTSGSSQNIPEADPNLTYSKGQSVQPLYHGWQRFPDGTTDLHFGYINRNWNEEIDAPIGPNNNVVPAEFASNGDAGQPTHFLPRNNRWQFKVRVPKGFEESKREILWTLTTHGETLFAASDFHSAFFMDEYGMQREFYGGPGPEGNEWPQVNVETRQVTTKVGEPVTISAIVTDDGIPVPNLIPIVAVPERRRVTVLGMVGNINGRGGARGLRFAWYVYRGSGTVRFNPPQFDVWENTRSGSNSPYSAGWRVPPVPPDNRWINQVTFSQPGQYLIRGRADDGIAWGYGEVLVTVTE